MLPFNYGRGLRACACALVAGAHRRGCARLIPRTRTPTRFVSTCGCAWHACCALDRACAQRSRPSAAANADHLLNPTKTTKPLKCHNN
eukprot:537375-Pleurochrysis_carterae.AAC.1